VLLERDSLHRQFGKLLRRLLPTKWQGRFSYLMHTLDDCFHRYIVGQCLEAAIIGMLCSLGMMLLRLPYATMVGALVGFTALIPVAGAYIGASVGAFMILTVDPVQALIFLVFLVILQQLEGNLIYPKVVGSSLGLPGIWVLAAVTVGGGIMGITGMLLGVPLAAAAYRLLREDVNSRPDITDNV
jgi:predicted PurR-regulated permease PerM